MKITPSDIEKRFQKYNKSYFGSALPTPKFGTFFGVRSVGTFTKKIIHGKVYDPKIMLARNVEWNEDYLQSVICHEMIHYFLATSGYNSGHGYEFRALKKVFEKDYGVKIYTGRGPIRFIDEKTPKYIFDKYWSLLTRNVF